MMLLEILKFFKGILGQLECIIIKLEQVIVEWVEQNVYFVIKKDKCKLFLYLFKENDVDLVLVFFCIKYGVNCIVNQLDKVGINVVVIYGNKFQGVW